jgi:DNA polymerase III delta prime subunit
VEADVYRALRDGAPSDWLVFFALQLVKQTPGRLREPCEVDFVVFAPEYGILAVEVKGGVVEVDDAQRTWHSIDRRGRIHTIADPSKQTRSALKGITNAFRREMGWTAHDPRYLLTGTALLFPDTVDVIPLSGPDRPRETLGGTEALRVPDAWLRQAFEFWAHENSEWGPLGSVGMNAAEHLFARRILVARPLARLLVDEHARQVELTEQQAQVLRTLKYIPRARIAGPAGTGKTLLALRQARDFAAHGRRTLFVCFNRALSDFLARDTWGVPNLEALTYDLLINRRLSAVKKAIGLDPIELARNELGSRSSEVRLRTHALARSTEQLPFRYEAIVVDEGQDFAPEAFLAFRKLLAEGDDTPWIVFFDPNQAVYRERAAIPEIGTIYLLTRNCRNTHHIHHAAYAFFQGDDPADVADITGEPLALLHADGLANQAALIRSKVDELLNEGMLDPRDVTVLVAADDKGPFYKALLEAGAPTGVAWGFEEHWRNAVVAVDTIRRFKGLEATVAILWGIEYAPTDLARELLYVALSRARSRVWIVGDQMRAREILRRCAVSLDGLASILS